MTRSEKEQALVTLAAAALSHTDSSGTDELRARYAVDLAEETLSEIVERLDEQDAEARQKDPLLFRYGQDGTPA